MITYVLSAIGVVIVFVSVLAGGMGWIKRYQALGLTAVGALVHGIALVIQQNSWATVDAITFAYASYHWWKGGGDDDTKKRIKRALKPFTPTRRTAPSAA